MVEQVVVLCKQLGAEEDRDALLQPLARAACEQLKKRLRPGVTLDDCAQVFPVAATMIVLDTLHEMSGEDQVTAFTAGEVSIRKEAGASGAMVRTAWQLMSPWTGEAGFAVQGVRG